MATRTGAAVAAAVRDAYGVTDPVELANLRKVGEGLSRRSVLNCLDNSRDPAPDRRREQRICARCSAVDPRAQFLICVQVLHVELPMPLKAWMR